MSSGAKFFCLNFFLDLYFTQRCVCLGRGQRNRFVLLYTCVFFLARLRRNVCQPLFFIGKPNLAIQCAGRAPLNEPAHSISNGSRAVHHAFIWNAQYTIYTCDNAHIFNRRLRVQCKFGTKRRGIESIYLYINTSICGANKMYMHAEYFFCFSWESKFCATRTNAS